MSQLTSTLDSQSQGFKANSAAMLSALESVTRIQDKTEEIALGKQQGYAKKGMLLPRQRLNLLIDLGSPFIELSALAGHMLDGDKDGSGAGAGCLAGIGYVSKVRCVVVVDNYAIKGGTVTPTGLEKKLRTQQIALENKLPIVTLAQSGGANLHYAAQVFSQGGRSFANQARLSAQGIPQVTVVHGSATAGGAYQPGLSDYVIMIRNQATTYLAGPPLLKAATGEVASDEELGGAEMHTGTSGVGDYLAEDDADGIRIAREIMANLNWQTDTNPARETAFEPPLYHPDELLGIVPSDAKTPYDVREIIARIADGSDFLDFKPNYDGQTICGHMRISGHRCGVIGNNGPITSQGAAKAAQFIQLCEQSNIAILFLHNTTGFMVGTESEHSGIIKHGAKLIQAVSNAKVAKISLIVGGSYGAGNYAMCGRGFDPRFLFAWPNCRTAVMGAAQAGMVLKQVTAANMRRKDTYDEEKLEQIQQQTQAMLEQTSSALACSARLWDDGIIDPRDSRTLLSHLLSICEASKHIELQSNHYGVARF